MFWHGLMYVVPLLFTVVVSIVIAYLCWPRRRLPGALPLFLVMVAVSVWALGNVVEIIAPDLPAKTFWTNVQYLGITTLPVLCLAFALQYSDHEHWLSRRNVMLLLIVPIITNVLVWTSDWHGLMRQNVRLDLDGPFPAMVKTWGPWFWFLIFYSYGLLLISSVLLTRVLAQPLHIYRGQSIALMIGIVVPWLWNVIYIFHIIPDPRLDLTPSAFTISGVAWAWALFRYRLLDMAPIAHGAVFERMLDGVIVLDSSGNVVDMNPVAADILRTSASDAVGQPAQHILPLSLELPALPGDSAHTRQEVALGAGEDRRFYDLLISSLGTSSALRSGRLIVWRDITEHKRLVQELQSALSEVKTLTGLLPICAACKKIRTDKGYWLEVEEYIRTHSDAQFTHGICPECVRKVYERFRVDA